MKRFYETVELRAHHQGFAIALDGKLVKTPARQEIYLPEPLAQHLADEWSAQGDEIKPQAMPVMRLVATALDRISGQADVAINEFRAFAGSDLLYYRADDPPALVSRQQELWDPVLDWATQRYDVSFQVAVGIMPVEQPVDTLRRLEQAAGREALRLSGLIHACHITGSAILALAMAEKHLTLDHAYALSCLDHLYQLETWGEDAEERQRLDQILLELESLNLYFQAL